MSGGWSPIVNLVSHRGIKPVWNNENLCFIPGEIKENISVVGSAKGIWNEKDCVESGFVGANEAMNTLGIHKKEISFPPVGGWSNAIEPLFEVKSNKLTALNCVKIDKGFKEIKNSNFKIKADLVLLAMGFVHPIKKGPIDELKLKLDNKGNILASQDNYLTSDKKVFAAGDSRRGQSLVVWAIKEGRDAAEAIHKFLS